MMTEHGGGDATIPNAVGTIEIQRLGGKKQCMNPKREDIIVNYGGNTENDSL